MKNALIPLLLPALLFAGELDYDLLGPEAYHFDPAPVVASPGSAEPGDLGRGASESRAAGLAFQGSMGLATGAATAAAIALPLAFTALSGHPEPLRYTAAGMNALGATAGIWLGGLWSGRSGKVKATLAGAVIGQVAGLLAGPAIHAALGGHPLDRPVSMTVTFALPTVLGMLAYDLTDR